MIFAIHKNYKTFICLHVFISLILLFPGISVANESVNAVTEYNPVLSSIESCLSKSNCTDFSKCINGLFTLTGYSDNVQCSPTTLDDLSTPDIRIDLIGDSGISCTCPGLDRDSLISSQLFFPLEKLNGTPKDKKLHYQNVSIELPNKNKLNGWYISAAKKSNKNIIYLHGNAGNISYYLPFVKKLVKSGANILLVDYEGFGKSDGDDLIGNSINDALAMYDFLIQKKNISPEDIIIYGYSYGGSVAVQLALNRSVHAVILESTFSSLKDVATYTYPHYENTINSLVTDDLLNTADSIKNIYVPLLVSYAEYDTTVPVDSSEKIYSVANSPKTLYKIAGAKHHNSYKFYTQEYINLIKEILD